MHMQISLYSMKYKCVFKIQNIKVPVHTPIPLSLYHLGAFKNSQDLENVKIVGYLHWILEKQDQTKQSKKKILR